MPSNLAAYFAQGNANQNRVGLNRSSSHDSYTSTSASKKQVPNYDDMGPSVSMAVHADNDDHFKNSTFNLKRTRSMGLLDPYIDDSQKALGGSSSNDSDTFSSSTNDGQLNTLNTNRVIASPAVADDMNDSFDIVSNEDSDHDNSFERNNSTFADNGFSNYNTSVGGTDDDYTDENMEVDDYNDNYEYKDVEDSNSPPEPATDDFLMHHDDNDLVYEPSRHVDYLSHKWNENEISQSWRYIILKKKKKDTDLINTARLENASWRTWAKARNNLKTVNPESLNWSKDSDVTWLYGPIVLGNQDSREPNTATYPNCSSDNNHGRTKTVGYGSDDENSKRLFHKSSSPAPKPILKKRSVSEIIEENSKWRLDVARQHRLQKTGVHAMLDPESGMVAHDDYNAIAAKVNAQYYKGMNGQADDSVESFSPDLRDTNSPLFNTSTGQTTGSLLEPGSSKSDAPILSSILTSSIKQKQKRERHIHFNDRVEQCIAVNIDPADEAQNRDEALLTDSEYVSDDYFHNGRSPVRYSDTEDGYRTSGGNSLEDFADDEDDDDDDDDDDDEGGFFISANIRKSRVNSNATDGTDVANSLRSLSLSRFPTPIIEPLPATTLNYGSDDEYYEDEENDWNYGNAVSHNVNTNRGFDYMYDYNSVYTGDTSNFMTVDKSCDIVDVPDGIGLDAPMEDVTDDYMDDEGRRSVFGFQQNPTTQDDIYQETENEFIENTSANNLQDEFDDDDDDDEYDDDEQVFDDGREIDSNFEEPPLLKRTSSLGKSRTDSLHDFIRPSNSASPVLSKAHSFITGGSPTMNAVAPNRPSLKSPSSGSFIFGSDSDSD